MKSKRSSFPFGVFAALAASAATTACGRSPAPEIASTSLTSAVVTPSTDREEDPICTAPESASTPPELASTSPAPAPIARLVKHVAKVQTAAVPPPADNAKSALDKTIADSVARAREAERQDATLVSVRPEVTTTSATVLRAETTPGAPVRVAFDNRLPNDYRLERLQLLVDGRVAYDGRSVGSVRLEPGDHVVEVIVDYRVNDSIFASAGGHGIELRSTEVIPTSTAPVVFVATATPKGGVTTSIDQRASLAWRSVPEGR